jgi:hypothetical protein
VARIANNVIRNVGGASGVAGIAAQQNNGGYITIENNTLDKVDPGPSSHQIQVNMENVIVRGNRITRPGATNVHNSVFLYGNVKNCVIESNSSDSATASFARISADNSGFNSLSAKNNICTGTVFDGIIFATSQAQSISNIDISGNRFSGVNSSAASDKRAIRLDAGSNSYLVSVSSLACRNNDVGYSGATQYPIGLSNFQPGSIAGADIRLNNWGSPTIPTGTRSCDSNTPVSLLVDDSNVFNGVEIQSFSAYNTYTDVSNYERGTARWLSNEFSVGTEKAGSGASRAIAFEIGGTKTWTIDANGHLQPYTDAGWDLGTSTRRVKQFKQIGIHCNAATIVSTPTTGQTVTVASSTSCQICEPAGSLAALTVQFPVQQADGHELEIVFTQAITSLTLTPNSGQTIVGGITSTSGYIGTKWRFVSSSLKWYRIQ